MEDYKEYFKENEYITTGELSKILNIHDATIRYYCEEFGDFIKVIKVKKRRFFKAEHVERFIYLRYLLKDKGLPIKLARDFLSTEDGKNMKPIDKVIETPLFSMMLQMSETLEKFANSKKENEGVVKNIEKSTSNEAKGFSLLQPEFKQEKAIKSDTGSIIKQIDFHIRSLKNAIEQYEVAKQYEFLDEMMSALSDVGISAEKIKVLNSNLYKPQKP